MPCQDSSSGLNIRLSSDEHLESFQFAKVTCSSEISAQTGLSDFCKGKFLEDILDLEFPMLVSALGLNNDEEKQFIMYLELDALKAGIAQYLGISHPSVDVDRCRISAVEHGPEHIDIALIILPPQELPKIIPCSKADKPEA